MGLKGDDTTDYDFGEQSDSEDAGVLLCAVTMMSGRHHPIMDCDKGLFIDYFGAPNASGIRSTEYL